MRPSLLHHSQQPSQLRLSHPSIYRHLCSSTIQSLTSILVYMMAMIMVTSSITFVTAIAPSQYMSAVPEALITWRPLDERFFFPNECFEATNRSCCPMSNGMVCGGDSIGICTNITATDDVCDMTNGWRGLWWFTTWFDSACVCIGNRTGAACERCMPGYSGDNCDVQIEAADRSDFNRLSTVDKQYVIDAFRLSKIVSHPYHTNVSVFDWVAALHRWSLPGITVIDTALHPWAAENDYATSYSGGHSGSGSITWHRSLTVAMEYALQVATGNTSFAMPYWNWTSSLLGDQDDTLKWFGGDGDSLSRYENGDNYYCRSRSPVHSTVQHCNCYMNRGPFSDWPLVGDWGIALNDTIMRAFGCQTLWGPSIPEQEVELFVVTVPYYDDWATTVEVTAAAAQATAESDAATAEAAIAAKLAAEEALELSMMNLMSEQIQQATIEQTSEIDEETIEDEDAGIYDPVISPPAEASAPPAAPSSGPAVAPSPPAEAAAPPAAAPTAPADPPSSATASASVVDSSSGTDASASVSSASSSSSTTTTTTAAIHRSRRSRSRSSSRLDALTAQIQVLVAARDAAHKTAVAAVRRAFRSHQHAIERGANGILNELQPLRTGGQRSDAAYDPTNNGWGAVHLTSGSASSSESKKSAAHVRVRRQLYSDAHEHFAKVHAHMKTPATDFTNEMYQDESTHASTFHDILGGGYPGNYASWPSAEKPTELHERIHRWLGGTILGEHPGSDPLFWMLHGYADVILERWLRNAIAVGTFGVDNSWGASGEALSHGRSECQAPFFPLRTHMSVWTNSKALGFTYDYFDDIPDGTEEVFVENRMPTFANLTSVEALSSEPVPTNELFFVPSSCNGNGTSCCPYSFGFVCGGDTRGNCVSVTESSACDITTNPSNLWWLSFTHVCECVAGYTGAACDSCAVGYTGYPYCTTDASFVVPQRSDFTTLDSVIQQEVVDAFAILKVMPSPYQPSVSAFDFHAATYRWGMSGVPKPDETLFPELIGVDLAYGDGEHGALTWRRQLLIRLENDLRVAVGDPTFALPYWKWTSTSGNNNDAALRWMGGDGDTAISDPFRCRIPTEDGREGCNCTLSLGVFTEWSEVLEWATPGTLLRRGFGCLQAVAPSLPSIDEVDYAVSIDAFDSGSDDINNSSASCFARTLTGLVYDGGLSSWPPGDNKDDASRAGLSQRVQNWIGGTATSWSPNPASDPLFWLHLTYTDLIFERWLRTNNHTNSDNGYNAASYIPVQGLAMGHNRDECMGPFLPLIRNSDMMLRSTLLGYDYDYFHL